MGDADEVRAVHHEPPDETWPDPLDDETGVWEACRPELSEDELEVEADDEDDEEPVDDELTVPVPAVEVPECPE
jgi:hypothetical protein